VATTASADAVVQSATSTVRAAREYLEKAVEAA
jgi:hypothetical protein